VNVDINGGVIELICCHIYKVLVKAVRKIVPTTKYHRTRVVIDLMF